MGGVDSKVPKVGFIGVGTMNAAIVRGLCSLKHSEAGKLVCFPLYLSPRNAEKAGTLLEEFGEGRIKVCASNEEVVESSDWILIALLPPHAPAAIPGLPFRPEHLLINLISTVSNQQLGELAGGVVPRERIRKAVPIPPVATHNGTTVVCPRDARVCALFEALGTVVAVEDEDQMRVLQASTAMMGPFYKYVHTMQTWLEANGVPTEQAAKYAGSFAHSISSCSKSMEDGRGIKRLIDEQTPGGLNENAIKKLAEAGAYDTQKAALDETLSRLMKAAKKAAP